MTRSRALDWVLGALGMLVLLVIAAIAVWWVVSEPLTGPNETPPTTPATSGTSPDAAPADLGKDDVWLGDVDVAADIIVLPDTSLLDVQARGHGAHSSPDGVMVEQLEVLATVPFSDVASQLGGDSRIGAGPNGQATIARSVDVLGRQVEVTATGTVEVVNGLLVVEPRSIDVGGPDILSKAVADIARRFVTIEQPIEGLPPNLVLRDVAVQDDGFRATLSGQDVVLTEDGS